MKELAKIGTVEYMTLKEITDLLEVRHNDAMKVVAKMAEDCDFGLLRNYRSKQQTGFGERELQTYQLDKRQSIAVAARLNTGLLMRIIDRWQELENSTPSALKVPRTYIEALKALVTSEEKSEALAIENLTMSKRLDHLELHATVIKGCGIAGLRCNRIEASALGKDLTRVSKAHSFEIFRVADERWGVVNSYHYDAWTEINIDLYD